METVFITGASQGIGLEFVRQYLSAGFRVIATFYPSAPLDALQALARTFPALELIPMDVSDLPAIQAVAEQCKHHPIDILINNAGIFGGPQDLDGLSIASMQETFLINTIAPLFMCRAFLEHVAKSKLKTMVAITSRMGSIGYVLDHPELKRIYAYRASKTALNMCMASFAQDTFDRGIKMILLHPGHVRTEIGKNTEGSMIEAETSIRGMRAVINQAPRSRTLLLYQYDGTPMTW